MKSIKYTLFSLLLASSLVSCDDFFDIKPATFIPAENVWNDPDVVNSVIAEMYSSMQLELFFLR